MTSGESCFRGDSYLGEEVIGVSIERAVVDCGLISLLHDAEKHKRRGIRGVQ